MSATVTIESRRAANARKRAPRVGKRDCLAVVDENETLAARSKGRVKAQRATACDVGMTEDLAHSRARAVGRGDDRAAVSGEDAGTVAPQRGSKGDAAHVVERCDAWREIAEPIAGVGDHREGERLRIALHFVRDGEYVVSAGGAGRLDVRGRRT